MLYNYTTYSFFAASVLLFYDNDYMDMDKETSNSSSRGGIIMRHSFFKEVWETVRFIIIALIIVIPIRIFIAQPFIVSGASMDPTFADGQYLIVDEISYYLNEPTRGDVVIFKYPKDPKKYFIKRIIGLPGENVVINKKGEVSVQQKGSDTIISLKEPYVHFSKNESDLLALGEDEYFVMGDNREDSYDSRMWGPVKRNFLVGKALVRLFPFTQVDIFPGQFRQMN